LSTKIRDWYNTQDRVSLWISVLVFLLSFGVYLKTMAPTVSFWDCGEFIACSYILGVPHPPGAPLFVLIGRIFTLIPLFGEIAARVNFISVLTSALTVWLSYLLIVKLVSRWGNGSEGKWHKLSAYVGGIVGSLFLGFGRTFWGNAVEAEVYGLGLMLMMLILYLGLLWMDKRGSSKGDRILVLIAYLGLLSIGVHMTVFLVMPVVFLLVVWEDRSKLKDFRFWIAGLILSLVMVTLEPFLALVLGWILVVFVVLWIKLDPRWVLSFSLVLVALVGYSIQGYIPIRSSLNPAINENNPDNWERFKYFLERKQYGQQSMVERMFTRRGSWESQFGAHPRMGFWGFFREQYTDKKFWLIPILLGGFGLWSQFRHNRRVGGVLLLLVLLSTVGLILYMNFSDGTRYDQFAHEIIRLEVRDRDYFFTPGFVFFALLMGLGASGIVRRLSGFKDWLGYGAMAVLLISPILPLKQNFYSSNNRSNKFIPYDYAYNLLNSCDKDGIMFTNGDNDTFPLWFAQEVEGIRKDVRIVNLSLLNTDWYILQLKDEMGVPIGYTDNEIKRLRPFRTAEGKVTRVQDLMIANILETNRWKYPIYFAATVAQENKIYKGQSIDNHLRMEGMAYRVVPEEGTFMVDVEKMKDKLFNVFKFRGLHDPKVYKNENDIRLIANYGTAFLTLADTLRRSGNYDEAIEIAQKNMEILPDDWKPYAFLIQFYTDKGESEKAEELLKKAEGVDQERLNQIYLSLAAIYKRDGEDQKALDLVHRLLSESPHFRPAFQFLFTNYYQSKDREKLVQVLKEWVSHNPDDDYAVQALSQISAPDFDFPKPPSQQR